MPRSKPWIILPVLILLSTSLACKAVMDNTVIKTKIALEVTQSLIETTQAFLTANPATSTPSDTPTPILTETPTSTPTEPPPPECIQIGCSAPDFTLLDMNGVSVSLSDYRGNHVLLNFWATWCGPCQRETPGLQAVYERYRDQNFLVLGISTDESETVNKVPDFVEKYGLTFPILLDTDLKVGTIYESTFYKGGIPRSFFIDTRGIIRSIGDGRLEDDEMDKMVRDLLAMSTAKSTPSAMLPTTPSSGFFDDFSNPSSGWGEHYDAGLLSTKYESGELHMQVFAPGYYNRAVLEMLHPTNHFILEVDVRRVEGSQGSYGLIFGTSEDGEKSYELEVTAGEEELRLAYKQEGSVSSFTDYVEITNANRVGSFNHLAIEVEGLDVTVYFNGEWMLNYTLDSLSLSSSLGLFTCTCDQTPTSDVYFDNFKLTILSNL